MFRLGRRDRSFCWRFNADHTDSCCYSGFGARIFSCWAKSSAAAAVAEHSHSLEPSSYWHWQVPCRLGPQSHRCQQGSSYSYILAAFTSAVQLSPSPSWAGRIGTATRICRPCAASCAACAVLNLTCAAARLLKWTTRHEVSCFVVLWISSWSWDWYPNSWKFWSNLDFPGERSTKGEHFWFLNFDFCRYICLIKVRIGPAFVLLIWIQDIWSW